MGNKCLSQSILEKIKDKDLKPRPKWHFWMRNGAFWSVFAISAIVGGFAMGIVSHIMAEIDPGLMARAHGPFAPTFFRQLPMFWSTMFLLFLLLAAYGLHHTAKGYKLSTIKLIGANLGLSLLIGLTTNTYIGERIENMEEALNNGAPFINTTEDFRRNAWSEPESGRLGGRVIFVQDNQILFLHDFRNREWQIDITKSEQPQDFKIEEGRKVKVVGKVVDNGTFQADLVGSWQRPRKGFLPW